MTIIFALINKIISYGDQRDEWSLAHAGQFYNQLSLKFFIGNWPNIWYKKYKIQEMYFFLVLCNRLGNYLLLKCKSNYLLAHADTDCLKFVLILKL